MKKIFLLLFLSFVLVSVTIFIDGEKVQNHEELALLRMTKEDVMHLGFPLPFVKQKIPDLDPPMPYKFGFSFWDIVSINLINYILSILIVFIMLLSIRKIILIIKNK